ncbi:MAG: tetratricopeptide repeat protein, partial [Planctomycetia bacterium]|nr:tetratricopeptide repeat protein [Planctomycetia bacterium]
MKPQNDLPDGAPEDVPADLLSEALSRHAEGDLEQAAPLYERVLRVDPSHADALYHLGKLELSRETAAGGADRRRRAAQGRPEAAEVQLNLGIACKRLSQWGDAAQAFERALRVDPTSAPTYFELGDLSQTLGRIDAAIDFYLRTINLDAHHIESFRRLGELLYARGNWVGAENCFARIVDSGALNGDVDALLGLLSKLGITLIRQNKLDGAEAVFRKILAIAPAIGEIHANLAYIYELQGRLKDALASGLRAIELAPEYPEGHNNLGIVYRALHQLDDACRCFERAVALKPDFPLAHFNRGAVELLRGNYAAGWRG